MASSATDIDKGHLLIVTQRYAENLSSIDLIPHRCWNLCLLRKIYIARWDRPKRQPEVEPNIFLGGRNNTSTDIRMDSKSAIALEMLFSFKSPSANFYVS